jgi:hypothetical protein
MTVSSQHLPVRILKIWFDVVLALGGVAAAIFVVWFALSPFLMARGDVPADATVQVAIGTRSLVPVVDLEIAPPDTGEDPPVVQANLVDARGELRLKTTDWGMHFAFAGGIMLAIVVVLYSIWILRRVLVNVLADRPFAAINGKLLRRCGTIVLFVGALGPVYEYVMARWALSKIEIANLELSPAITFNKDVFVVGLLFLVFGLILTRGHELQVREETLEEEQALTI